MCEVQTLYRAEDLISTHDVMEITGRGRHTIFYWMRRPDRFSFPAPIREFAQFGVFDARAVRQWVAEHPSLCRTGST